MAGEAAITADIEEVGPGIWCGEMDQGVWVRPMIARQDFPVRAKDVQARGSQTARSEVRLNIEVVEPV